MMNNSILWVGVRLATDRTRFFSLFSAHYCTTTTIRNYIYLSKVSVDAWLRMDRTAVVPCSGKRWPVERRLSLLPRRFHETAAETWGGQRIQFRCHHDQLQKSAERIQRDLEEITNVSARRRGAEWCRRDRRLPRCVVHRNETGRERSRRIQNPIERFPTFQLFDQRCFAQSAVVVRRIGKNRFVPSETWNEISLWKRNHR